MALFNAETIVLNEEESFEFVNDLIRPDSNYIERRNAVFEATDRRMTISECDDGFVVDVPDFDFSAIKDEIRHEVSVSFDISDEADVLYVALTNLAKNASLICNQIVSKEVYSYSTTWNNHGKTTRSDLPIASQRVENKAMIDNSGSLNRAA